MSAWSMRLRGARRRFYGYMEEPGSPYRIYYHYAMIVLVCVSIWLLVMEVQSVGTPLQGSFTLLGDLVTALFTVEYLLRWWINTSLVEDYRAAVAEYHRSHYQDKRPVEILHALSFALRNKLRWMLRPLSLVDLVAILPLLPSFHLMRVLHLLKLFRYSRRVSFFSNIIGERSYEMVSLLYAAITIWGMTAVAFFVVEHRINERVQDLGDALYWTIITITTVGYGDITPVTDTGRFIASLGVLMGMAVTVMLTSLIVSVFTDRVFNLKEYHMEQKIARLQNHFIVCGLQALGQFTCQSLVSENRNFIAIDTDQERVDAALAEGWIAIRGDVNDARTWERARLSSAAGVISTILNEATNVYIIMMAREINPKCFVVACGNQSNSEQRLLRIGADRVVSPYQNAGQHLAQTAIRPNALQFLNLALNQGYADLVAEEIVITPGAVFDFTLLRDSRLREEYNAYVVGILSQGVKMLHTPPPDYRLIAGDVLICLGHKLDLERLKRAACQIAIDNVMDKLEMAQIWVGPNSSLIGVQLEDAEFRSHYRVQLVGMVHERKVVFKLDPKARFTSGDVLICLGFRDQLDIMRQQVGDFAQTPMNYLNLELERIHVPMRSFLRGKSLRNAMLRSNFACTVVAVQPTGGDLSLNPMPDYRFAGDEEILCLGSRADLDRLKGVIG
ncbi:MAG: NAD-binding protein [Magnetococcales bacterium]|nr:NAD-binding protein [Magnetococcales bacterium]